MTTLQFPFIRTRRAVLRLAEESDAGAALDYFSRNRAHFAPTDPPMPAGFLTLDYWKEQIPKAHVEFRDEKSVRLFIFDEDSRVIGSASFTQIFRGPLQACFLGYGIDGALQGQGFMTEGLAAAIQYMFEERNLHRIMANHLPENQRSARVLQRLGFQVEGLAKEYLFINGAWRDHVLNSLINSNWRPR